MSPSRKTSNAVFSFVSEEGFEQTVFCHDPKSGLKAIITIHNTHLGPSLGGLRFFNYADEESALLDCQSLARAMTYKAASAGLKLGGGKSVILGDPKKDMTPALLKAFGKCVDRLGGAYITTVDSGTTPAAMDVIREVTRYVVGVTPEKGGSGDPSPTTAAGVFQGIRAAIKFVYGSDTLVGKKIAIQGLGSVGYPLAERLSKAGARLIVTDKNRTNVERAIRELGAEAVAPEVIFSVPADVLAPCALGKAIHAENAGQLQVKIIAGAANNQLASEEIGSELSRRGIVYAPDFVINAGGLIHVSSELNGFDPKWVEKQTMKIYDTVWEILDRAKKEKRPTSEVALSYARERLK